MLREEIARSIIAALILPVVVTGCSCSPHREQRARDRDELVVVAGRSTVGAAAPRPGPRPSVPAPAAPPPARSAQAADAPDPLAGVDPALDSGNPTQIDTGHRGDTDGPVVADEKTAWAAVNALAGDDAGPP